VVLAGAGGDLAPLAPRFEEGQLKVTVAADTAPGSLPATGLAGRRVTGEWIWHAPCRILCQSLTSPLSQFRRKEPAMSMLVWIILGLVSGFIASKIVNRKGEGFVVDILLGVVGAIVGGWLFGTFGKFAHLHRVPGVTGLNLESLLVAVVGAVAVLVVYHALRRSTAANHRRRAR